MNIEAYLYMEPVEDTAQALEAVANAIRETAEAQGYHIVKQTYANKPSKARTSETVALMRSPFAVVGD